MTRPAQDPLSFGQVFRLVWIESEIFACSRERVTRAHVAEALHISILQAGIDFASYRARLPLRIMYDPSLKAFVPVPGATPYFPPYLRDSVQQAVYDMNAASLDWPRLPRKVQRAAQRAAQGEKPARKRAPDQ